MVTKCEGCGVEHDDPEKCPTCNQKNPEKAPVRTQAKPAVKEPAAKSRKKAKKAR